MNRMNNTDVKRKAELLDSEVLPTGSFSSPNHPVDRTFTASFNIPEITRRRVRSPKLVRLYRNPVFLAEEWRNRMHNRGFSQADLARELGVSRARVTQVMNVLKLSKESLDDLEALGDPMSGRRMTERMLRKSC